VGSVRSVKKILQGQPVIEGAGVRLKRVFGFHEVPQLDPFLLLDDFHSQNPPDYLKGFPWHPHRGIETITYVRHGEVEHGDSMGNKGVIRAGDVQWMTAGSGIVHQEMPQGEPQGHQKGLLWGFQLWANLPAAKKMMPPRYREIKSNEIPEVLFENGIRIEIICGRVGRTAGPVTDVVIDPQYLVVSVPARTTFQFPTTLGHTVFAYVTEGAGYFDRQRDLYAIEKSGGSYFDFKSDCLTPVEQLVLFDDGDEIIVTSADEDLRFLLVSGRPIGEPVAWQGPIVMNTRQELQAAFKEYQEGTFIK